ncbi:MAG: MBL fold metallo-hydrolase [Fimbriimonas sp.]
MADRLTITAYSTALYSTWVFVEELRLLFDAGDGVTAHLLGKSRKAERVALSHSDRDHVTGLLQLQQLTARATNRLEVIFPADSGSIPRLAEFCAKFDPWSGPYLSLSPVRPEDEISLGNDLVMKVMVNTHVPAAPGVVKSVSYFVVRRIRKLCPEFRDLPGVEIARLRAERGEEALTFVEERGVLAYAGDTGITSPDPWRGCATLIHEATFLRAEDMDKGPERTQLHSMLPEVLAMAREASPSELILTHFSSRYGEEEIQAEVRRLAQDLRIEFPVHVVPPGRVVEDVLAGRAVWPPVVE